MTNKDEEQLRLLSQLHYAASGLTAMIPLVGLGYIAFGVAILLGKVPSLAPATSPSLGWFSVGAGLFFFFMGGAIAGANILTAGWLRRRERRTLCLLTAGLNCLHPPLGTLLGAFTISVLSPAVIAAFLPKHGPPSNPKATPTALSSSSPPECAPSSQGAR